ncbi:hypothetical protein [Enterobacter hormaechei]
MIDGRYVVIRLNMVVQHLIFLVLKIKIFFTVLRKSKEDTGPPDTDDGHQ